MAKRSKGDKGDFFVRSSRLLICIGLAWMAVNVRVNGQNYLGLGMHLTPPVYLQYTRNPYVIASPRPGVAFSVTFKKEWIYRSGRKWYGEAGLTTQGLLYKQVDYFGDSTSIWSDFPNRHTGYPSILVGGGHTSRIGRSGNEFSSGLEASYLIAQDLDFLASKSFGIQNHPLKDATFPLFLRLNLAFQREIHLSGPFSGQFQVYTSLSVQNFTKGSQFIRNLKNGTSQEGNYHVNNSEFGLKFFTTRNKKNVRVISSNRSRTAVLAEKEQQVKARISLSSQFFNPSRTVYHIPQVDSFSVKGKAFSVTHQFGLLVEIPFRKHPLWSTVFGAGVSRRASSLVFSSQAAFSADQFPVSVEKTISGLGLYSIFQLGLSHWQVFGRQIISHTLSMTAVVPLEKENVRFDVPLSSAGNGQPVLEGLVAYDYGREKVVFGLEYNPEVYFKLSHGTFIAMGLVVNYSNGVLAQGKFRVSNDQTTYYGASLQRFSKIGISARVGLARS